MSGLGTQWGGSEEERNQADGGFLSPGHQKPEVFEKSNRRWNSESKPWTGVGLLEGFPVSAFAYSDLERQPLDSANVCKRAGSRRWAEDRWPKKPRPSPFSFGSTRA